MKHIPITFAYSGMIANIVISEAETKGVLSDKLTMFSASTEEESLYVPANSFTLYGSHSLKKLRDALLEAYPLEVEDKP